MTDIVERLRARIEMVNAGHGNVYDIPDEMCIEAADEIERLMVENAWLRVACLNLKRKAANETERLRAENEDLKSKSLKFRRVKRKPFIIEDEP